MHQAEPEAAQFIERKVAVVSTDPIAGRLRLPGQCRSARRSGPRRARAGGRLSVVVSIEILGVARLGVGQMGFFLLDLADEGECVGESVGQTGVILELSEARIDDGDGLQDIAVFVELEVQRVGDARVRDVSVVCLADPIRSGR